MGNSQSTIKINYEFVQSAITSKNTLLINTMKSSSQECLISTTLSIDEEEGVLNSHVGKNKTIPIIVYGINSCDDTVDKKYKQLTGLGFQNVYLYPGGIFEWLLLQDIYGSDLFSTTETCTDPLKYKNSTSNYSTHQNIYTGNSLVLLG